LWRNVGFEFSKNVGIAARGGELVALVVQHAQVAHARRLIKLVLFSEMGGSSQSADGGGLTEGRKGRKETRLLS
jgi:hypothetical protein